MLFYRILTLLLNEMSMLLETKCSNILP